MSIGNSFCDGFKYPLVDSLTAPWRFFGFRFLSKDEVWIYAVVILLDGTSRKLAASTTLSSWGFTGEPQDEYRIPLGNLKKGKWHVAIVDVQSIEVDLPTKVRYIAGFRARGPVSISHIWCVDSKTDIPYTFRSKGYCLRYPR